MAILSTQRADKLSPSTCSTHYSLAATSMTSWIITNWRMRSSSGRSMKHYKVSVPLNRRCYDRGFTAYSDEYLVESGQ